MNYIWFGKYQLTCTRANWKECCMEKKYKGLGLVDPKAAQTSLLCKWIVEVWR